jgi:hypothetical protein
MPASGTADGVFRPLKKDSPAACRGWFVTDAGGCLSRGAEQVFAASAPLRRAAQICKVNFGNNFPETVFALPSLSCAPNLRATAAIRSSCSDVTSPAGKWGTIA